MKLYRVKVNGKVYEVELEAVDEVSGSVEAAAAPVAEKPAAPAAGDKEVQAPITGKVIEVKVKPGQAVKKGQTVVIIEAMKLENEIQSPFDGKVKEVYVAAGNDVRNKDVLLTVE